MTLPAAPSQAPSLPRSVGLKPNSGFIATFRALWPYLWPAERADLKGRVVGAFALMLAGRLVLMGVPFTFKWITDALAGAHSSVENWLPWLVGAPLALTLLYGLARVGSSAFVQMRDAIFAPVFMHAVRTLALQTFGHLHYLSLRFHLERKTGGLTRVLERGRNGIEEMVRLGLNQLVPVIIEVALIIAVLLGLFDWRYVVVLVAMVVIYMTYTIKATEWRIAIRSAMNESDTDANSKAIDSLLNYETVKYFNNEAFEARRYDESLERFRLAQLKSRSSLGLLNSGQQFIIALALVAMLWLATRGVVDGRLTLGDLVMVNAFMIQIYIPLNFLGVIYREIKQSLTDLARMFTLMDKEREVRDAPDAQPLVTLEEPTVRFEDVHFAYAPDRPILRGVSFEIAAGRTVAVVGPSGAGKSTLARLLFRFYDVQAGRITIAGQDIRGVTQESLRRAIGIVPQDTVLFNDTIAYNIAYGRTGATQAEVEQAARAAHIHDFIASTPQGYDATVGERGLKLSGGEKQRVAIARTLLKNPAILILDEATSALDTKTEKAIQGELLEIARSRTSLIIAHRLSTVVEADEILVMEDGRIVERGRHPELLEKNGVYAHMWALQQQAEDHATQ